MNLNQSPTSLRFCLLCDKPFTGGIAKPLFYSTTCLPELKLEASYSRHVSYCRRSRNRPRQRQQSCRSCRLAKVKCSFHARCHRCVEKDFECLYDRPPRGPQHTRPTPLDAAPLLSSWPLALTADARAFEFQHDASMTSGPTDATDENDLIFSDAIHPTLVSTPAGENALEIRPWYARTTPDWFPGSSGVLSAGATPDAEFLIRLPISDPIAQHSATLVMQALRAFPQMMLRELTFPPFTHAHCHRYPLPEPLAYCMSIAHIFVSPEAETRPYLWESIEREQQRFLDQMTIMSKEDLLAAVQAQLIYIIMRVVVEDAPIPAERSLRMLVTFQMLCARFMKLCDEPFCLPEKWIPGLTWNDWVFAESRRRTACVWFLVSRVVCVKTGIPCDAVESFPLLPLASPKNLWEASTRDAWESEYEVYRARTPVAGMGSFGSLLESNRRRKEPDHARRLDAWNASADTLGSLLNCAVFLV